MGASDEEKSGSVIIVIYYCSIRDYLFLNRVPRGEARRYFFLGDVHRGGDAAQGLSFARGLREDVVDIVSLTRRAHFSEHTENEFRLFCIRDQVSEKHRCEGNDFFSHAARVNRKVQLLRAGLNSFSGDIQATMRCMQKVRGREFEPIRTIRVDIDESVVHEKVPLGQIHAVRIEHLLACLIRPM